MYSEFSNYGTYDRLTQDGITQWHPAFLVLGATLEICAAAYRKFCKRYRPKPKSEHKSHWGSKLLKSMESKPKKHKTSPGQLNLWDEWEISTEIHQVAEKFVVANCFNPKFALALFPQPPT